MQYQERVNYWEARGEIFLLVTALLILLMIELRQVDLRDFFIYCFHGAFLVLLFAFYFIGETLECPAMEDT